MCVLSFLRSVVFGGSGSFLLCGWVGWTNKTHFFCCFAAAGVGGGEEEEAKGKVEDYTLPLGQWTEQGTTHAAQTVSAYRRAVFYRITTVSSTLPGPLTNKVPYYNNKTGATLLYVILYSM